MFERYLQHLNFGLWLFVFGLAGRTYASTFAVANVSAVGKACDPSTVTATISPDGNALTLNLPGAGLELSPPKKLARATCSAIVTINHPDAHAATSGTPSIASTGPGNVTTEARLQTPGHCGASTNLIIEAAILMKSAGKTTMGPSLTVPLTWTKCVKTTHN